VGERVKSEIVLGALAPGAHSPLRGFGEIA
jgi:hypothetical protein